MTEWYFDIETEGTDPQKDKILTIQYQQLDEGRPTGPFQVLAEWEWGEKQIVRSIVDKGLLEPTGDFVPVGNRLMSDITFVMEKAERHGLKKFTLEALRHYWFRKPLVDLAPVLLLMNRGRVAAPSVSAVPETAGSTAVPALYLQGRFQEIIDHVTRERDETLRLLGDAAGVLEKFAASRGKAAPPPSP